jgi:malonate decarboxylase delta subunit
VRCIRLDELLGDSYDGCEGPQPSRVARDQFRMETMTFEYPALNSVPHRAHVGIVGSGDLEVLLEPSPLDTATVQVCTSVQGYGNTWKAVLDRFFAKYSVQSVIEINDFGATPGMVALRLEQALEQSRL